MKSHGVVDFLVIGAGIAGASVAASLAQKGKVAVLEMEAGPGYHSTGRSAAIFSEIYGNSIIRSLSRASREFFFSPSTEFQSVAMVRPREAVYFARPDQLGELRSFRSDPVIEAATSVLSAQEVYDRVPIFADGYLAGGVVEHGSADLDVEAIHQGFLRQAKARKASVYFDSRVLALTRQDGLWIASTKSGSHAAPILINAAGAWGDEVARLAAIPPVDLQPRRRTACLIKNPSDADATEWPAAVDISEDFYFKPDAGMLLLSPADEHLSAPCDAQPEELDVAIAVDRFEKATGLQVRQVAHKWAGLRVFTSDRTPVVGFEPSAEGFFWLVGQGGYGIQTSPALGRLAAAMACSESIPGDISSLSISASSLSRTRLASKTQQKSALYQSENG